MQPFVEPDYLPALPELFLAGASVTLLMAGVFIGDRSTRLMTWLACVAMAAAFVMVLVLPDERTTTFFGLFVVDRFAAFMKCLVLVGAAVTLIVGLGYVKREGMNRFEFPVLIVFATLGMLLMISANDLIALYVGLELQSLSLYIVAAFRRDSLRSTEAGLKYFVLGAISSGLLLYGCSMVYGFTGVTGFEGIAEALATTVPGNVAAETGVLIGLVFIAAALGLQGLGGALPYVDARRLRRRADACDRLLRRGAQGRGYGAAAPGLPRPLPRACRPVGPDHHLRLDRLHGPRRLRRNRAEEHQAADGL